MQLKKIIIIGLLLSFVEVSNVLAQSSSGKKVSVCKNMPYNADVELNISYGELSYDFTQDTRSLSQKSKALGNKNKHVSGLAVSVITWGVSVSTTLRKYDKIHNCVVPEKIDVFIGYENPIIYVSKDIKPDTCRFNLVVRHEQAHQQIYKSTLEHFSPKIKKAIHQMRKDIKPIKITHLASREDAAHYLRDEYHHQIGLLVDFIQEETRRENGRLDTTKNYKKEDAICR